MNKDLDVDIQAALESVDYYYDLIVTEMQEARADALEKGIDYEFDVKLLSRFVWAIEALAEASEKRRKNHE